MHGQRVDPHNTTTRQQQPRPPHPNSNCYTTHRHGARRYEKTVSFLFLRLCADKSIDRREHRQQRVRGAG